MISLKFWPLVLLNKIFTRNILFKKDTRRRQTNGKTCKQFSHLLPSTPTHHTLSEWEKKILWHYLNGFVSIGELKEWKKVQQLCNFETKKEKIEKSFLSRKTKLFMMYKFMDTRIRRFLWPFNSAQLSSFRSNLNHKSFTMSSTTQKFSIYFPHKCQNVYAVNLDVRWNQCVWIFFLEE